MKQVHEKRVHRKQTYWKRRICLILGMGLIVFILAGCGLCSQQHRGESSQALKEGFSGETIPTYDAQNQAPSGQGVQDGQTLTPSGQGTQDVQTASPSESENEKEKFPASISLIMVGDILLHDRVEESALRSDGSYDFTAVFANVREEIQAADLSLVNQEVIIGGTELGISGYPAFNAPYEIGDALVDAGFDVVCHSTNHALDKGKKGLLNCLSFWRENHPEIAMLGIHDSQESQDTIYVYEQDGIKIAVLNYTYGTNGIALPQDMPFAVDLLDKERVAADLQEAEKIADFTVVCPHWGTEYALGVSAAQKEWTQIFLKNGADLVLGTHPHVIEPIEWVKDEEQGLEMLVYYSLGNFVNWTSGTGEGVSNRMVGGMAQVTLERAEDGKVHITDYGVMPLVCHVEQGMDGVTVYALSDYTEELAERNAIIQQDAAFSLEYCRELCHKVWEREMGD